MKFCYLDETGTGQQTAVIIVGVIVDVQRMNRTKREWDVLLPKINSLLESSLKEIKGSKLIPNPSKWKTDIGKRRLEAVDRIIRWLSERKHKIVFAAVDKSHFKKICDDEVHKHALKTEWNLAAFHIVLSLQKCHQKMNSNKGNTVFIFDKGKEPPNFFELVNDPPSWSDTYYNRKKQDQLDQIVDVPFFADSKLLPLIQIADLICYILRRYAELKDYNKEEKCEGELACYEGWVDEIKGMFIPSSHRYIKKGACKTSQFFTALAPDSLRQL